MNVEVKEKRSLTSVVKEFNHVSYLWDEAVAASMKGDEVALLIYRSNLLGADLTNNCVLMVENQLTQTDHGHLGQILTYAAGTEARTPPTSDPNWGAPSRTITTPNSATTAMRRRCSGPPGLRRSATRRRTHVMIS